MLKRNYLQLESSNEILAARIAQHDVAALEIIFDRFASQVFSLAAMLSDCTEAERIVLQVFSHLWFEIDQFILHGGSFQDWLLDLTRTHILIHVKCHEGQTVEHIGDAIDRWLSEATNQTMKAGEGLHKPNSDHQVWQALQDLSSEQRYVIVLAYYGGFKQKEIAQLLDWPLSGVKKHVEQGLKRLRDILELEPVL